MIVVYPIGFLVFYFTAFASFYQALSNPISWMTLGYVAITVVLFVIAMVMSYSFLEEIHKLIRKQLQNYIEEIKVSPESGVTLRHEKEFVNHPKRLYSVRFNEIDYSAEDAYEIRVTSDHLSYIFLDVPGIEIFVIKDTHKGTWTVYSRAKTE
jgi:hypothetical protein